MSEDPVPGPTKRSVLVLYASETGNAQEVAEELGDLAERLHFVTLVSEMNNFKPCVGIAPVTYVYDLRYFDYGPG